MLKRLGIASALGFICGIICLLLSKYAAGNELTTKIIVGGLINRTLMGFVIGSTSCPWKPVWRGAMYGFLISLTYVILAAASARIPMLVAGTVYGILIDVITTNVFKADGKE
jgi:hypothetical protein